MQVISMELTDITTVLTIQRMAAGTWGPAIEYPKALKSNKGAVRLLIRFRKLSSTNADGHQEIGSVCMISFLALKAPVIIQYSGKVKRIARMTITTKLIT